MKLMKLLPVASAAIIGMSATGTLDTSGRAHAQAPATAGAGGGQSAAAESAKFDVASVKANRSGDPGSRMNMQPGGRFTATNVPLRNLIRNAYLPLQDFQLVGGPDWITSDRFDIAAKAEGDIAPTPPGTPGPMQFMLRALLAERFKLVVHQEKRQLPIYVLSVARSDGRLGPQLAASKVDCEAMMTAARARGVPPPPQTPGDRPVCGMRMTNGRLMGGGFPLSQLAASLAPLVQRVVVDRTGLGGNYDLDLAWTPEQMPQGTPPPGAPAPPAIDPNGPSIFTAVQEQLGLKLDSQRGDVDVLVIDRAERPTEN